MGWRRPIPFEALSPPPAGSELLRTGAVVVGVERQGMTLRLDPRPNLGQDATDDVIGGANSGRLLDGQHPVEGRGRLGVSALGKLGIHIPMAETSLDVVAQADGLPQVAQLHLPLRLNDRGAVVHYGDRPPLACLRRLEVIV